jgi:hypothetical protein
VAHPRGAALLRLARRQARPEERVRHDAAAHGDMLRRVGPLVRAHARQRHGHALLLPLLARLRHRRRLPAERHHHVGVRQQEDLRHVHRRRLRDAGLRHPRRRHRHARPLHRVPRGVPGAGVPDRRRGVHRAAGRLRVARHPHARRGANDADVLPADEDARDGAVHSAGGQERDAGRGGHDQGAAGGDPGGGLEAGRDHEEQGLRPLLHPVPAPPQIGGRGLLQPEPGIFLPRCRPLPSLGDSRAPNPSHHRRPLPAPLLTAPSPEGATLAQPGWASRMVAVGRFPPDNGGAVEPLYRSHRHPPVYGPRGGGREVDSVPRHLSYLVDGGRLPWSGGASTAVRGRSSTAVARGRPSRLLQGRSSEPFAWETRRHVATPS